KTACDEEREKYEELQHKIRELTEIFNSLLLRLDKLKEENNRLIQSAQKSLGARLVTYILTLPFDRLGVVGDLLQRYFESVISSELIQGADNFMRQVCAVKQKAQYALDQIAITRAMLEIAAKELEESKKRLEDCEKRKK